MKAGTKRFLIELVATAIASPAILFTLLLLHAFSVLAFIAMPVVSLGRVLSDWIELKTIQSIGAGLTNNLDVTFGLDLVLLVLWTWLLLALLVTLTDRFLLRRRHI
jgi:hypothetical protein